MTEHEKPAGASIVERFRNQHVAIRWGAAALVAMIVWLLLTAI
jgi:Fe2+ transport system protein FeoA